MVSLGELVNLNIDDIDFEGRECVVYGKGDKERRVYFDAKTKVHLKEYIENRIDDNTALFVTLDAPYDRLKISGVEIRLRKLGRELNLERIHPHKFRRSMATRAIDKGMPIEQVQKILGHVQVGVVIKPSQYYTDKSEGVRTFRSLNIGAGFIKDIDWVYFTKEGHQKNSKSILKKDDLLIVRSGAPGTACVVTEEYTGCNAVDIIIAHPDCKKVNPYYLCTFTNMPHGKKQIDEGIGGAAQQHFNVGKYNKLQLMLPPKTLQDEFVGFVKQVDKSKFLQF